MYKQSEIKQVLCAGAGTMGLSFAQIFARHGYEVVLYDIFEEALPKAQKVIEVNQKAMVDSGEITAEESAAILDRITLTTSKEYFKTMDFLLEAIAENMDIKHNFYKEVSEAAKQDTILCSNTSGMSITEIAKAVKDPSRFCGMHWVNPPHLIPLVEVIAGAESSDEVIDVVYEVALSLNQKPIKVFKDPAGFILNRLQYACLREACNCVQQGYASVEDVDNAMKYGLGLRYSCIGPFETVDFGGIHIFNAVGSYMFDELCNDGGVPEILKALHEEGKKGVSTGSGFYDYSDGKDVEALAKRDKDFMAVSKALGLS